MTFRLEGRVAVVTGGTTGIGFAVAEELAQHGASVVVTGLNRDEVDQAVGKLGEGCSGFEADVSKSAGMDALYNEVRSRFGRLDIVVANAGVGDNAPLGHITEQQFDKVIGTNLKGVLFTVQAALPYLKAGASVIVIGSTASESAPPEMSLYGATKAGVRNFVKTWIKDTMGSGIRFNVLSPGAVNTPSLRKALGADGDEAKIKELAQKSPLGRIGEPVEIARVVAFLASDMASYINGVELFVDGGLVV